MSSVKPANVGADEAALPGWPLRAETRVVRFASRSRRKICRTR